MMTTDVRIETTALRVHDLDRALTFWTDGCGLTQTMRIPSERSETAILKASDDASSPALQLIADADGGQVRQADGFRKLVLSSPDINARMAAAIAHGGTEVSPPRAFEYLGGMVIGTVSCPDGYLIEFIER